MATGTVRGLPAVLDRYMLPRVAFVLVSLASLAGAILTGMRHGWVDWAGWLVRWSTYWTLGLLMGSEMWKVFYLRPSVRVRPTKEAVDYAHAMLGLHRSWQKALLPLSAISGIVYLLMCMTRNPVSGLWVYGAGAALLGSAAAVIWSWRGPTNVERQDSASVIALAGLAATIAILGGMDVSLQVGTNQGLLIPNRALHLWAFSAWLGGALWNIAIAVPAGITRVNMDTVILANFQLERFRVVVRTVFPTIVLTGLLQAWSIFDWSWQALYTSVWGYLVMAKLGLILLLVGVFIACPMWRACSPIRGVCDLDDL